MSLTVDHSLVQREISFDFWVCGGQRVLLSSHTMHAFRHGDEMAESMQRIASAFGDCGGSMYSLDEMSLTRPISRRCRFLCKPFDGDRSREHMCSSSTPDLRICAN